MAACNNNCEIRGKWKENILPIHYLVDADRYSDVMFSPNGEYLSLLRNGQLYIKKLNSNNEELDDSLHYKQLTNSSLHPIGLASGYGGGVYCWSPDSKSIIFVCNIEPKTIPSDFTNPSLVTMEKVQGMETKCMLDIASYPLQVGGIYKVDINKGGLPMLLCENRDLSKRTIFTPRAWSTGLENEIIVTCHSDEILEDRYSIQCVKVNNLNNTVVGKTFAIPKEWDLQSDIIFHPTNQKYAACIVWRKPYMQWDSSYVLVIKSKLECSLFDVCDKEDLMEFAYLPIKKTVDEENTKGVLCAQVQFSPNGEFLSYITDEFSDNEQLVIVPFVAEQVDREFFTPNYPFKPFVLNSNKSVAVQPWVTGSYFYSWLTNDTLVSVKNNMGIYNLEIIKLKLGHESKQVIDYSTNTILGGYVGYYSQVRGFGDKFVCNFSNFETNSTNFLCKVDLEKLSLTSTKVLTRNGFEFDENIKKQLSPPIVIEYPLSSCDEMKGKAILYLSNNNKEKSSYKTLEDILNDSEARNLPSIFYIHGGPNGLSFDSFSPFTQYFTSRGYLVVCVNYRGSYGFGRKYRQCLNGNWGVFDALDSCDAFKYLNETLQILDPSKSVILGGSAGGYTVSNVMARYPNVFAAGVNICGVADLQITKNIHTLESHYYKRLIGPLNEETKHIYEDRSPINHASKICKPILVLHGEKDEVVPIEQTFTLVNRIPSTTPCSFLSYKGAGHVLYMSGMVLKDLLPRVDYFLQQQLKF
ncbi:hypothetical protein ABK040_005758 [Willaertia magna]